MVKKIKLEIIFWPHETCILFRYVFEKKRTFFRENMIDVQCENYGKLLSHFFNEKFVKASFLLRR